jgi:hypothetical protein
MLNTATIRSELFDLVTSTSSFTSSNTDSAKFAGDSIASGSLPFCVISFLSSDFEYETIGSPRSVRITCNWAISIYAGNQTQLDTLTEQVMAAITDRTLSGNVQELKVVNLEYQFSSEADAEYGRGTLTLMSEHVTELGD